jgi:hypothetical protein
VADKEITSSKTINHTPFFILRIKNKLDARILNQAAARMYELLMSFIKGIDIPPVYNLDWDASPSTHENLDRVGNTITPRVSTRREGEVSKVCFVHMD